MASKLIIFICETHQKTPLDVFYKHMYYYLKISMIILQIKSKVLYSTETFIVTVPANDTFVLLLRLSYNWTSEWIISSYLELWLDTRPEFWT